MLRKKDKKGKKPLKEKINRSCKALKNEFYNSKSRIVINLIMVLFIALLVLAGLLLGIFWLDEDNKFYGLLYDVTSALAVAIIVGTATTVVTKIIENNFVTAAINNKKMKDFGITALGTGVSTTKDIKDLFGRPGRNNYPTEIKILFISGNVFFEKFRENLTKCLKNSDCIVRILLLNTFEDNNLEYVERMDELCHQTPSYPEQVECALDVFKSIYDELGDDKKSQLQIRFYRDQYRYNYRIAKYGDSVQKCWLNVQPFTVNSSDLSIRLDGEWDDNSSKKNIFAELDTGFDLLWDKYESTEYKF